MSIHRLSAAIGVFLSVGAGIGGTVGYAAYHCSDEYRRRVELRLNDFFGLPLDIGGIQPYSFSARQLNDVKMWLPDRRAQLFHCPRAIWDNAGVDGLAGTAVHIYDAKMTIGSDKWQKEDYMRVLRASLAHNFRQFNIRQAVFHNARFLWPREDFGLNADGVEGSVVFDDQGIGQAKFVSNSLNGSLGTEPIQIFARLEPSQAEFIPQVTLVLPRMPLATLGLDRVLKSPVTQGAFAGHITLRQTPQGNQIELKGAVTDVRLEELTRRIEGGPIAAVVNLSIEDAVFRNRELDHINFRGVLQKLQVNSILSRLKLPLIGGEVRLNVDDGQIVGATVKRLHMGGEWTGGSLESLTAAMLGHAGVQGQLRVRVNSLHLEDNQLVSGDVDVIADPPARRTGTIDRTLLVDLFQKQWGIAVPESLLPPTIEFLQIGAKMIIDHQKVRVLSAPGPAGPAIITARIFAQDIALLGNLDQTFSLDAMLQKAHQQIEVLKGAFRKQVGAATASRPAQP